MALANYSAYTNTLKGPTQSIQTGFSATTYIAGRLFDCWRRAFPSIGSVGATATAPINTDPGALPFANGNAGRLIVTDGRLDSTVKQTLILCDRVSYQGGLSGTTTGEQTTNLPTAALTRYTDGVGVMAGITIYTQIGATATTFTIRYTNQAGTGSRVSKAVTIGGTNFREAGLIIPIPLADGDTGITSVQGVTLLATTGTIGSFGVTLFKPLLMLNLDTSTLSEDFNFLANNLHGGFPEIVDNSCLFFINSTPSTTAAASGFINFSEV